MPIQVGLADTMRNKTQEKETKMSKKKNPKPWLQDGKFELRSCNAAEAYLKERIGTSTITNNLQVTRTATFLIVTYLDGGVIKNEKIRIPGGVLYCFEPENFNEFVEKVKR